MARNEMYKLEGGGITLECVVDQNALVEVYEVRGGTWSGKKGGKFLRSMWDSMDDDAKYVIARRIEAAYGLTGILPKGRFHDVAHRMEGQHPPSPNLSAECWSLWLNPEDLGWSRGAQSPPDDYWEVLVQRRKIMDVVLHSTGKSIAQQFTSAQLHELKMAVIAKHNTGPLDGYTGPTTPETSVPQATNGAIGESKVYVSVGEPKFNGVVVPWSDPEPEAAPSRDLYTNAKSTPVPIEGEKGKDKSQGCQHWDVIAVLKRDKGSGVYYTSKLLCVSCSVQTYGVQVLSKDGALTVNFPKA